ncbi:MAG: rRNA pseudouridine synthase [Clostridiales bacterium]|nr:rRNA pseudouridine synthase [Clostridiales bacterium]
MRINKYIASAGICSRRKADELITNGQVKINGKILQEPGYEVLEGDSVSVNGRVIELNKKHTYVLLNKPVGVITSVKDDKGRVTVIDLLNDHPDIADGASRLYPVGRLDYDTSGILLLTDDGDMTYRLTHPKHEFPKTYQALVRGVMSRERELKLVRGVDIGGFVTSRAKVKTVKIKGNSSLVEITIHEGKNRQVRKMFEAVGNPVMELRRVSFGEIRLGRLKEGDFRKLTKKEIEYLMSI